MTCRASPASSTRRSATIRCFGFGLDVLRIVKESWVKPGPENTLPFVLLDTIA